MRIRYWPLREPPGGLPSLDLKPYIPSMGWGDRIDELEDHIDGLWGHYRNEQHTVVIRASNELCNAGILGKADGGEITHCSVLGHIEGGCSGWLRLKNWFESVCTIIKNTGYDVGAIVLDFESPMCGRRNRYGNVKMWELLPWMVRQGYMPDDAPHFDEELMGYTGNPWSSNRNDVLMQQENWLEYVNGKTAERLTEVFHDFAVAAFGAECWTSNYGFQDQSMARMRVTADGPSYWTNATVGGYSSPSIYLAPDFFPDVSTALAALDVIPGDTSKVKPWFILPHEPDFHPNYPNYATPENTAELLAGFEERGITDAIGW